MRYFFQAIMVICGLVLLVEGCSRTTPSEPQDQSASAFKGQTTRPHQGERPERQAEETLTAAGDDDSFRKSPNSSISKVVKAFVLHSPEVVDGGQLPIDYTGDGTSSTLPLDWSGVPEGTHSLAIIMHHIAPDRIKWYWILYDIPADVKSLTKNVKGVGTLGNNSVNGRMDYAPPHSKGPGPKKYIYTLYALKSPPKIEVEPSQISRDVLLAAMKDLILDSAELHVFYTRFPDSDHKNSLESDRLPPLKDEQQ
jgi:Raf kinase inhibitor-like YbhB/YbcL family protein